MFKVVITEKGGAQRTLDFDKNEVTIGRVQGNDIILPKGNVSKRHSRIVFKDNRFIVVDLKSTNGTYVNGRKITSPLVVKPGDKIYIGDFILTLDENPALGGGAPAPMAPSPMAGPPPMTGPMPAGPMAPMPPAPAASPTSPMPGPSAMGGAPIAGPPPLGGSSMGSPTLGGGLAGPPPMAGPPPLAGPSPIAGPPPLAGPPPIAGPPPMAGPPPLAGPPPIAGPSPMAGPPPLAGPPPIAGPSPMAGGQPMTSAAMAPPAIGVPSSTVGERRSGPPPRPGPPPISPTRTLPSEPPPPLPPGADRFNLHEDPADETMAPAPRVVGRPAEPRVEPPPPLAPKADSSPGREPVRLETPGAQREVKPEAVRVEPRANDARPNDARPNDARPNDARPNDARPNESVRGAGEGPRIVDALPADPQALGPLAPLLEEPGVIEVVVEGSRGILVDRGTGLAAASSRFGSASHIVRAVAQLFGQSGTPLTAAAIQEAVLPDGSHVTVVLPPVAIGGPLVEIRRVGRPAPAGETLVSQGMLSNDMLATLRAAVAVRRNVVVVGPEDAGVPVLLSALVQGISSERVVTIENSPELTLGGSKVIRFTAAGTPFGPLIARAARLRADRVVIDGVRGAEAREALVALAARGSATLLGVRAVSHAAVLEHLEALAALAGGKDGVAPLIGAAVHVVVRMARGADGTRRVESIAELGTEGLVELFELGENGFASTGYRPSFMQS